MDYSVNSLTTAADCDVVTNLATKEKQNLTLRKLSLEKQQANYAENAVEVSVELQTANAEYAAYQTIVASLPDGEMKEDNVTKMKKVEIKLRVLNGKKVSYGNIALLDKQFDYARVVKELEETETFLATVAARKAAL